MAVEREHANGGANGEGKASAAAAGARTPRHPLRSSLFEESTVEKSQQEYRAAKPYRHLVIPDLMDSEVLKGACEELKNNMQATLKETDIFKVSLSVREGACRKQIFIGWLINNILCLAKKKMTQKKLFEVFVAGDTTAGCRLRTQQSLGCHVLCRCVSNRAFQAYPHLGQDYKVDDYGGRNSVRRRRCLLSFGNSDGTVSSKLPLTSSTLMTESNCPLG